MTEGERIRGLCEADPEFGLMARFWTGSLHLDLGHGPVELVLEDGKPVACGSASGPLPAADEAGVVSIAGPAELWDQILAPVPPRFCNDIMPAVALGLRIGGHQETLWQYYPAIRRLVELLREARA
jgi:hypothetical protein